MSRDRGLPAGQLVSVVVEFSSYGLQLLPEVSGKTLAQGTVREQSSVGCRGRRRRRERTMETLGKKTYQRGAISWEVLGALLSFASVTLQ